MQENEMKAPAKSVVQVYFPAQGTKLAYFNDRFDLHVGDIVYVEGKLEGLRGQVVDVAHNFKIKVSEYKRVIGKADTAVSGTLHMADRILLRLSPASFRLKRCLHGTKPLKKKMTNTSPGMTILCFRSMI